MARVLLAISLCLVTVGPALAGFRIRVRCDVSIGGLTHSVVLDGEPLLFARSVSGIPQARVAASSPDLFIGGNGQRLTVVPRGDAPRFGVVSGNDKGSEWTFEDRKSTRLNSSHLGISYAVFCLK